jgi:hypothetical protein
MTQILKWNIIRCQDLTLETIKHDLLAFFEDFHHAKLWLHSLKFGIITLIPKKEALKIQQHRPICLRNVSFKIFSKVLTN